MEARGRNAATLAIGRELPKPPDAVAVEHRFVGYERNVAGQRLGDEHPVEGVAVELRQGPGARGVVHGDGQFFKTLSAIAPAGSRAISAASGNLPSRCLVAISHAEAALISTSFDWSPMARRAAGGNRRFPASHHKNAWVSRRRRNDQLFNSSSSPRPSHRTNSSSGSGSKKLSSMEIRSFQAPNCRFPFGWYSTSRATGLPLRAMTTSSQPRPVQAGETDWSLPRERLP